MFSKIDYTPCIDICWDILTYCNFDCPYCFAKKEYQTAAIMSKKSIDMVIEIISSINNKVVVGLLGGEPTIHPLFEYIVSRLADVSNVIRIKVVTNSSKDLTNVSRSAKIHYCLSYHPTENRFCLKNLTLPNTTVYVLMLKKYMDEIYDFYNIAAKHNVGIIPEYIVSGDNVNIFSTKLVDPAQYNDNGVTSTFAECYGSSFKGHRCHLSHYKITAHGDILVECIDKKIGTIYTPRIADHIVIRPIVCTNERCTDDFLLEMMKE